MEENTKKDEETSNFAPVATPMRPGHVPCTQGIKKMAYAPGACRERVRNHISTFLVEKS